MNSQDSKTAMNKRGIELSLNFVVILILGIVLFAGGAALMYKVFAKANDYTGRITGQMEAEIDKLFEAGEIVAVPTTQKTVRRGDLGIFPIGITNELRVEETFLVVLNTTIENEQDAVITAAANVLFIQPSETLQADEQMLRSIGIDVKKEAAPGTYILGIIVCKGTTDAAACIAPQPNPLRYGDQKRIRVVVP